MWIREVQTKKYCENYGDIANMSKRRDAERHIKSTKYTPHEKEEQEM